LPSEAALNQTFRIWWCWVGQQSFWDSLVLDELGEAGVKRLREEDSLALKLGVQRLHESVVGSADPHVMAIR
jgi:hypothetical protein